MRAISEPDLRFQDAEPLHRRLETFEMGSCQMGLEGGAIVIDLIEDDDIGVAFRLNDIELPATGFVPEGMKRVVLRRLQKSGQGPGWRFELRDDNKQRRLFARVHDLSLTL